MPNWLKSLKRREEGENGEGFQCFRAWKLVSRRGCCFWDWYKVSPSPASGVIWPKLLLQVWYRLEIAKIPEGFRSIEVIGQQFNSLQVSSSRSEVLQVLIPKCLLMGKLGYLEIYIYMFRIFEQKSLWRFERYPEAALWISKRNPVVCILIF